MIVKTHPACTPHLCNPSKEENKVSVANESDFLFICDARMEKFRDNFFFIILPLFDRGSFGFFSSFITLH